MARTVFAIVNTGEQLGDKVVQYRKWHCQENMDCDVVSYWYYDKEELLNTPSIQDGIDYKTECRYRKEGADLIINIGVKMELGYNTIATAAVYFHRFYMSHSFKIIPRYVTACCCLFLAGKVEETPKKCNDIIETAQSFLSSQKFSTYFGENPKEEVIILEKILLQTIKFDFDVEHPYRYLPKYAKCLKGKKEKLQQVLQQAWDLVAYSLCTTLCLQWKPEIIAISLLFLASKFKKFKVTDWFGRQSTHRHWWDMFVENVTVKLLEEIGHQVLDIFAPKVQSSELPSQEESSETLNASPSVIQQSQLSLVEPHITVSPSVGARSQCRSSGLDRSQWQLISPTSETVQKISELQIHQGSGKKFEYQDSVQHPFDNSPFVLHQRCLPPAPAMLPMYYPGPSKSPQVTSAATVLPGSSVVKLPTMHSMSTSHIYARESSNVCRQQLSPDMFSASRVYGSVPSELRWNS